MDPHCPECERPVGATATSCMHCDAEFPQPAGVDDHGVSSDSSSDDEWIVADDAPGAPADTFDTDHDASGVQESDEDGDVQLAPSGVRIALGVAAAPVFGFWTLIIVGALTTGTVGFVIGTVVWLILTVHLISRPTIFDSFQSLCYTSAILFVLTPFIVLTDAAKGGTFLGQLILFAIGEVIFGVIAAGLAGIGYRVGQMVNREHDG